MKVSFFALAALLCSFQGLAQTPSLNEENFCQDRQDAKFIKDLTLDSQNLMTFRNHGGIGNGGVCWWHSRFQRNALYLTIYKPQLNKPTLDEAKVIIKNIHSAKDVVIIPGFKNFSEFVDAYTDLVQTELENWQLTDGSIGFAWVKGLSGDSIVSAKKLKELMDATFEEVEVKKNIAYNKLQMPGILAHAWLVIRMEKTASGYNLEILDSNIAGRTEIYRYRDGDTTFNYHNVYHFSPYLEQTNEMQKINMAILKQCNPEAYAEIKKKEEAERKAREEKNRNY
jgi:hypothetical protein